MAKPTTPIPSYATDATFTSGIETGLAPTLAMSGAEVTQGVKPGKLVARKFNWLVKLIVDWVRHIEVSRPDFVAGDSVYQEGNVTLHCAPGVGLALTGGPSTDFSVDRACTFTQTVGITGDLKVHESATIDGDCGAANVNASLVVTAGTDLRSSGLFATGCTADIEIAENAGYTLEKETTYVSSLGSNSYVTLPEVTVSSPKLRLLIINSTGSGGNLRVRVGTTSVFLISSGTAALVHWNGFAWKYVNGIGTFAGSYTPA